MKTIYLHGYLKPLGESFTFDVPNPAMAFSALKRQVKGFAKAVRDGEFMIIIGPQKGGFALDENELSFRFGQMNDLHVVPVVKGSGGNGTGIVKTVLGVALLAVGVGGALLAGGAAGFGATAFGASTLGALAPTWGTIASIGVAVSLAGASSLLSARPNLNGLSYEQREQADQRPSYLFNGPQNASQEGLPVPLVYGRMLIGSVVGSTGLVTEQI